MWFTQTSEGPGSLSCLSQLQAYARALLLAISATWAPVLFLGGGGARGALDSPSAANPAWPWLPHAVARVLPRSAESGPVLSPVSGTGCPHGGPGTAHLVFYLRLSTWCRWEDTQSLPTAVLPVNCLFEIPTVTWPGWESQELMRPHDSWGAPPRDYGCACHPQRWSWLQTPHPAFTPPLTVFHGRAFAPVGKFLHYLTPGPAPWTCNRTESNNQMSFSVIFIHVTTPDLASGQNWDSSPGWFDDKP